MPLSTPDAMPVAVISSDAFTMNEEVMTGPVDRPMPTKGRGACSNRDSRYSATHRETITDDEAWENPPPLKTTVEVEASQRIISRNHSPDVLFQQSVNPYRGCEHGCIYCYARPSHAYLGLSPGLDFESRLFAKRNAASLLRRELAREDYIPAPIALGANTDPYQPIEREWRLTRQVLEVLRECRHPVSITTKSALVERDMDLLTEMAETGLAQVQISVWLETHVPLRASHVLSRLYDVHGGKIYRSEFGARQTGTGAYADMIRQRFRLAARRNGLSEPEIQLDTGRFRSPVRRPIQTTLF